MIVAVASMFLASIFVVAQYAFQKNIINLVIKNQNINSEVTRNFITSLKTQCNSIESQNLNEGLQNNYHEFLKIYTQKTKFDAGFNFFDNIFQNLIFIITVILATYLMINNNALNIGQLTFLISLSSLLNNGINGICNFLIRRIEFNKMSEIFQKFMAVDNISKYGVIEIADIKKLSYKHKGKCHTIKNGSNIKLSQRIILDLISGQKEDSDYQVWINDKNLAIIKNYELHEKLFYVNASTKINPE